ncbi:MAG: YceI family protein, partial [Actinomycetota bacterium]
MRKALSVVAIATAVVVVGLGAWFVLLRDDAPEAFELTETETTEGAAEGGEVSVAAEPEIDGAWTVAAGSEAGYRVVEDLGEILDFEAVGRTDQVTGTIEISGEQVTAGSFEVDVASITSDDGRRDTQFMGPIMNAAEFPTATLVLTAPLAISASGVSGTMATGDLTLRGVTQPVQFPVEAQVVNGQIEVAVGNSAAFMIG